MKNYRPLTPDRCCLYIVDPQVQLMQHIFEAERVTANIALCIRCAQTLNIPILANTQYKKGIGPIVPELTDLLADVPCPDKTEFSGLANAESRQLADNLPDSVDTLLLAGIETHICIYQTAVGALDAGFQVQVIADAVSSRSPRNDALGQQRLRELGVILAPAEMLIYELLQRAGTPEFKAMLPFLK